LDAWLADPTDPRLIKEISRKLHPISRKLKGILGKNQDNLNGVLCKHCITASVNSFHANVLADIN
jgi:hypothetical protein